MRVAALALAVPALQSASARAQAVVQSLPGTTDADRLADQMRVLVADPSDLDALITAGELSLKLDDLSGAASLFARADKVDSRNARLKAGEASVLVRSERPGEALRYFAQAQSMGLDPARFAGDRGLAYDLIGEQERAQRDYRLALRRGPDEEVTRRYALSLGISGKRDMALEQLDPLLRETDRGAWRARAFVLAMAGDVAGAERIATTMMPPGMADGLQPFFERLPVLPAIDRAFAVHFGETRATPERSADARLVPPLPALGPDPYAPVHLAAVAAPAPEPVKQDRQRKKGRKEKPGRVEIAAAVVPAASAAVALPPPPAYRAQSMPVYAPPPTAAAPMNATARANAQQLAALRTDAPAPVVVVATPPPRRSRRDDRVLAAASRSPDRVAAVTKAATPIIQPRPVPPSSSPTSAAVEIASAMPVAPTPSAAIVSRPALPVTRPAALASTAPDVAVSDAVPSAANGTAASSPPPSPGFVTSAPAAVPSATVAGPPAPGVATAATDEPPLPKTLSRAGDDTILARIIAGLSIPASELGVTPAPAPAPAMAATHVVAEAKAKEARDAAAEKLLADKAAAEKIAADRKKAAVDRKALAAKKAADEKKAADAKAAAEAKKAARADPARLWVQVSGGANEGDLPKAWAATKARAPAVFAGKSGWSTPLRATNRVLAGPFKTVEEARAFVNQLAKAGVAAFNFSSDAGQKVTRLPAK